MAEAATATTARKGSASDGACLSPSAAAAAARKRPAPDGDDVCPSATATTARKGPAPDGASPSPTAAAAAARKRPPPDGACSCPPAAAAAARKRPATDGDGSCPSAEAAAAKKRARYQFSSINNYEQLEVIGEGSYGVVFKARDRRTGGKVAVKWIRSNDDLPAVVREAGCLAACRGHPSIVEIKDVATNEATGDMYIVMELLASSSLRDWLTRPLPEERTRAFMRQLLDAAMKLHSTRTLHRDIKPENILVIPGGVLKICDFGCATPMKPAGTPYPEQRVGTMQYCSPEQLMGSRSYGPAVDMWALGCVMAELLTGQPLFDADTEEGVLQQIKDLRDEFREIGLHAFDVLPDLSQAGREVLASLLRFDPDERLTAADAVKHQWFTEDAKPPAVAKAEYAGFVPLFSAA